MHCTFAPTVPCLPACLPTVLKCTNTNANAAEPSRAANGNRLIKSICRLVWLAVFALTKLWAEQLPPSVWQCPCCPLWMLLLLLASVSSASQSVAVAVAVCICAYSFEMQLDFYVNWATVDSSCHWRPGYAHPDRRRRGWAAESKLTSHLSMHLTYFPCKNCLQL